MKRLLSIFAFLCISTSTWAYGLFSVNGIHYKTTSTTAPYTVEVTCQPTTQNKYSGIITIPSTVTISGKKFIVTRIGNGAFRKCIGLISITIPSSVTSIGDNAFYFCKKLSSIVIPSSVKNIDFAAFMYCSNLRTITLSSSLTSIESNLFNYCTQLKSITIPASVENIEQT